MPTPPLRVPPASTTGNTPARIRAGLAELRERLELPDGFPAAVLDAAERAAAEGGLAGDAAAGRTRLDLTDVDFVTIDPPGSTDLDQALWIGPDGGGGHLVRYAIADVAAFVGPGDPVDAEARARGLTVYLPDGRVPLHPPVLGEHAASLRSGEDRPALVWSIALDRDGARTDARVERAVVRSRVELDYPSVQRALDGTATDPDTTAAADVLVGLRDVGRRREAQERDRGGVSLPLPDQEVVVGADGSIGLAYRAPLPVEGWNAQLSLLAGMAAADLMLDAGVGVLRTLPPPDEATLATLRTDAAALDVPWPPGASYAEVVRSLDVDRPEHAAFATQAARLFRGAGYLHFDEREPGGSIPVGSSAEHAAVAAPYAHVTAPLRRLVDRYANEVVVAHCAGRPVPDDVRAVLPELPRLMGSARNRESRADGAARDLVETALLADRAGRTLAPVVDGVDQRGAQLQQRDPAVLTRVPGAAADGLHLGQQVLVTPDPTGAVLQIATKRW